MGLRRKAREDRGALALSRLPMSRMHARERNSVLILFVPAANFPMPLGIGLSAVRKPHSDRWFTGFWGRLYRLPIFAHVAAC
jgi:hypothetical protein